MTVSRQLRAGWTRLRPFVPASVRRRLHPLVARPYDRLFPERRPGAGQPAADLAPGDEHYRAYVGPPEDYDLVSGLQFGLLLAAGLREGHRLLDVGCGSLRGGRLAIPYLGLGGYYGIEPNRWLVDAGIREELGRDLVEMKKPTFAYVSDFSAERFGVDFDFIMAQSVFSHTHADLFGSGLLRLGGALAPEGVLLATFVEGPTSEGEGWLYPEVTSFGLGDVLELAARAGLVAAPVDWPHPRQRWLVAGRQSARATVEALSASIRSPRAAP